MPKVITRTLCLSEKLSSDLDTLFLSPSCIGDHFADITIHAWERGQSDECEPVVWRAHSAVLAARSRWWRACLTHDMVERNRRLVRVHQTPAHILGMLLRYLYSGVIELVPNTAMGVLVAANMYNEMDLLSECVSYLKDTIVADHALDLLAAARKHHPPELAEAALEFVRENGEACLKSDGLLFARKELLLELFDDDVFDCPEIEVFHAIVRWARANRGSDNLCDVTSELFEHVRFALIPADVLNNVVRSSECVFVCMCVASPLLSSLHLSLCRLVSSDIIIDSFAIQHGAPSALQSPDAARLKRSRLCGVCCIAATASVRCD